MQHEITEKKLLLNEEGHLSEAGFARSLILDYHREDIKASSLKIKEWDYYLIGNEKAAVALTIADNSYMGLDSISIIDFTIPWQNTNSVMQYFTRGKKRLPSSSEKGHSESLCKKHFLSFKNFGDSRFLSFKMNDFNNGKPISGEITLTCPHDESIVMAIPFEKNPLAFYYNQKINCMPAEGFVRYAGKEYIFKPEDSFGVLDWGRGVWTYKNTWYWASASGIHNGKPLGFNLGYGFGDVSAASENALLYDGRIHKLSRILFNIPSKPGGGDDYMSPWSFTSDDGRFEMDFIPIIDRASCTDFKLLCSDQHQVFGRFTGNAVLDDGTILSIKDFLGFAEKVYNKW